VDPPLDARLNLQTGGVIEHADVEDLVADIQVMLVEGLVGTRVAARKPGLFRSL
jgi:hypothetical protein